MLCTEKEASVGYHIQSIYKILYMISISSRKIWIFNIHCFPIFIGGFQVQLGVDSSYFEVALKRSCVGKQTTLLFDDKLIIHSLCLSLKKV